MNGWDEDEFYGPEEDEEEARRRADDDAAEYWEARQRAEAAGEGVGAAEWSPEQGRSDVYDELPLF